MSSNLKIKGYGHLHGPLTVLDSNNNPVNLILLFDSSLMGYIQNLVIKAPAGTQAIINNQIFEIGKTEILNFPIDTKITFLSFTKNINSKVSMDFIYINKE